MAVLRPAPVAQRSLTAKPRQALRMVVRSVPDQAAVEAAIKEAKDACDGGAAGEW
jgi:hypothetical protein